MAVYRALFAFAMVLCVDSVIRSEWASSKKRKAWGGIGMFAFYSVFGFWIFLRQHKKQAGPEIVNSQPPAESHGTTDKVAVKPEHHGTIDKATVKVEHRKPPLQVIQTATGYGNLKQECVALSGEIAQFVEFSKRKLPQSGTPEENIEWARTTDIEYRFSFERRVEQIYNALKLHDLRDYELDDIMKEDKEGAQDRTKRGGGFYGRLNIHQIKEIGEKIGSLGNKIPQIK